MRRIHTNSNPLEVKRKREAGPFTAVSIFKATSILMKANIAVYFKMLGIQEAETKQRWKLCCILL